MLYQAITGDGTDQIKLASGSGSSSTGTVTDTNKEFVINGDFIPSKDSSGSWKSKLNSTLVTDGVFYIVDGFGKPFQYDKAPVTASGSPNTVTVNPNFDVWSYANGTNSSDSQDGSQSRPSRTPPKRASGSRTGSETPSSQQI